MKELECQNQFEKWRQKIEIRRDGAKKTILLTFMEFIESANKSETKLMEKLAGSL